MNVLHLMSDAEQGYAIRDMRRLLKENGILVASCVACNAGNFTEDIIPEPGRYMAKVTINPEKEGVDNTVKEFILLIDGDETDYTPQAYYISEGGAYVKKSLSELLELAKGGMTECYRYVHHIDKPEFLRMFSNAGFNVEYSGEYTFCDASETSFLAGLTRSTAESMMKGAKGFYVVARKIPM